MPSLAAIGTRVAGRFLLEALAGEGGMGAVYRARDEQTGETVALKLTRSRLTMGAHAGGHELERFARESALLSTLRHPGIVAHLAHGVTEAGEPYLAMQWLDGEDLSKRLARGELGLEEGVTLLRGAAEALAVLHEHGVVHRDLKPSNLFLRDGRVERLALLDLGIARQAALSQGLTRSGTVMGTPAYMAPEQARGERDVTPAADVFSLGCVFFECLTGTPPFVAEQPLAVLAKILFDEPPSLRRLRPELPEAVEALLGRMLAKATAARLPDAKAILAALTALDDLSLDAVPVTLITPGGAPRSPGSRHVDAEQHLISVLIATPPPELRSAAVSPDSATLDQEEEGRPDAALLRALAQHGARVEVLADGSLVAALVHTSGAATDQAVRAARCARLIKARWPAAAVALSTGRGHLADRLPVGEVLERAAALLRGRPAGTPDSGPILLDEVTRGLLEVRFLVHRTPGGGYALGGEGVELDASRPLLGKPTPCVGRDVELGTLERTLAGCLEDREPRAVLVTAPPGAGKSRLRHEFVRRAEAHDDTILILLGRGEPMSAGSSYGLLGQALRRLCGIQDGEALAARRAALSARLAERVPRAALPRVAAFLGELCGAPFPDEDDAQLRAARQDPPLMSAQITQAMLDLLRAECAARPVLLVLEDLHWGDALTVRLCEAALRKLKDCPLMVLALARPEVDALFPRLWSGAAQVLPLLPLGKKAGERLVHQVLGAQASKETTARIVEQSEGNALLLEELIRSVAEGRGDEAPGTVLAMLQVRIGRLEAGARRVLRAASVFGETSRPSGIRALLAGSQASGDLDALLARLTQDEILEEMSERGASVTLGGTPTSPVTLGGTPNPPVTLGGTPNPPVTLGGTPNPPGEPAYRFRHALMRDAAYGLLTEDDRVESHRRAGAHLEAQGEPDALVLAEHFLQGLSPERAIPYLVQAAEQSHEANDVDATLSSAERGLACGAQGQARGALLSLQVAVHVTRERYLEATTLGTEALSLLPEGSLRWCRASQSLFQAVTFSQQIPLLGRLAAHFAQVEPSADARSEYVIAAAWLGISLGITGAKAGARLFLQRVLEVGAALDRSDVATRGYMRSVQSSDHHVVEEAPWSCMLRNGETRDALRAAGEQRNALLAASYCGKALHDLGDHAGAEAELRENLARAERLDEAMPVTYVRSNLARLLASVAPLDRLDEPAQLARSVIEANNLSLTGIAHGVLAEIARRRGDLPAAEAEARAACQATLPFPPYSWDLRALLVRILLEQGRAAEALALGEEAVRALEQLGLSGAGELALRLALAEARDAAGQADAAREMLADALPRLRKRADDIPDAAARARYLAEVPTNARLLSLARAWLGEDAVHPSRLGLRER